ncbi:MAG TPA: SIS domain-containing protein [Bacteroidia bacterium]|nr:SIS domain-containing protein [Bacteroidia bacterium]
MQTGLYSKHFESFFASEELRAQMKAAVELIRPVKRIFFLGNGGSNSICSHMMEDYGKIARYRTYAFSDAPLITCYANDYGYENAMAEWIKLYLDKGDLLIAISSSGESKNIVNAAAATKNQGGKVITLTGFSEGNTLAKMGDINMHLPVKNYGVVECFHQTILHIILDSLNG